MFWSEQTKKILNNIAFVEFKAHELRENNVDVGRQGKCWKGKNNHIVVLQIHYSCIIVQIVTISSKYLSSAIPINVLFKSTN